MPAPPPDSTPMFWVRLAEGATDKHFLVALPAARYAMATACGYRVRGFFPYVVDKTPCLKCLEVMAANDWEEREMAKLVLQDGKQYEVVVLREVRAGAPEGGERTFRVGDRPHMFWRGDSWWSSFDIDGAFILPPDAVRAVKAL